MSPERFVKGESERTLKRLSDRCEVAQGDHLRASARTRVQPFCPFQPETAFFTEFGIPLGYAFRRVRPRVCYSAATKGRSGQSLEVAARAHGGRRRGDAEDRARDASRGCSRHPRT